MCPYFCVSNRLTSLMKCAQLCPEILPLTCSLNSYLCTVNGNMSQEVGTRLVRNTTSVMMGQTPWLTSLYDSSCTRSPSKQSSLNWLLNVFTIKVNILCFVCAADVSLWLDHLNNNSIVSRKQPSAHVYVVWNIKIDISNFPVSKVKTQDMAAA